MTVIELPDEQAEAYDVIFELAKRYALTFYDAAYLELAIREEASIATLDEALRGAAVKAGIALFGHKDEA
jgi:predicted nucleic acid-binding protein